jgi:hypothetical protein
MRPPPLLLLLLLLLLGYFLLLSTELATCTAFWAKSAVICPGLSHQIAV